MDYPFYLDKFKKSADQLDKKLLAEKQLEEDGLITRKVYTSKPPLKVDYTLTEFGKTLIPVLNAIAEWGIISAKNQKKIETINENFSCLQLK